MSNIPSSFNNFRSLNIGSVWALYLLLVIILRARFCDLNNLLHSKPQHVIPNCKCERMRESYINFMTEIGRYLLSLFITPRVRDILFAIFDVCAFQLMYSFIVIPQKIKRSNSFIFVSQMIKFGISFAEITLWWLWKTMNLVFWTFMDNLLTASQSDILHSSKLIKVSTRLMLPLPRWVNEHKGLVIVVSSAYKMNLRLALTLWISFIYMIKSRGPNIEPWVTPVSITRVEDAVPSNSTYWRRCVR